MATTRIKDISKTTTDLASDTYGVFDGATNGTQKMARNDMYADWAAAYVAAPTTYKLAPLNSGTNKIDATYLPTSGDTPKGEWNASTNSPSLADGSGTAGDYYDVTTAGSQDLGSGSIAYTVGDVVKYNGSTWYKIDSVANFLDGYSTAATSRAALEVNSIDEDAQAYALKTTAPALYFNGTSSNVVIAADSKLVPTDGTNDTAFSGACWVKADDLTTCPLFGIYGTSAAARNYRFNVGGSDKLTLLLIDTGGHSAFAVSDTAVTAYEGEWVHFAFTYGGSDSASFGSAANQITLYVNGTAVASTPTNDNGGTYDGMTDGSNPLWIGRFDNSYKQSHIRNVQIFNRELTATEVAELAKGNDLGFADEWAGALGGVYTSDFSNPDVGGDEDLDGWIASQGAVDGNIDSIGGQDNNLRLTVNTNSGQHYLSKSGLVNGKNYKVSFDYYIPSGQSNIDGIRAGYNGSNNAFGQVDSPTLGAWNSLSGEAVAGNTSLLIFAQDGGNASFQDAGGDDVFYIRNVKVTQIGTLADFRAEDYNESASKLLDRSSNNFVGVGTSVTLTGNQRHISADTIDLKNLPTSSAGLSAGEVWSNGGVLTVV